MTEASLFFRPVIDPYGKDPRWRLFAAECLSVFRTPAIVIRSLSTSDLTKVMISSAYTERVWIKRPVVILTLCALACIPFLPSAWVPIAATLAATAFVALGILILGAQASRKGRIESLTREAMQDLFFSASESPGSVYARLQRVAYGLPKHPTLSQFRTLWKDVFESHSDGGALKVQGLGFYVVEEMHLTAAQKNELFQELFATLLKTDNPAQLFSFLNFDVMKGLIQYSSPIRKFVWNDVLSLRDDQKIPMMKALLKSNSAFFLGPNGSEVTPQDIEFLKQIVLAFLAHETPEKTFSLLQDPRELWNQVVLLKESALCFMEILCEKAVPLPNPGKKSKVHCKITELCLTAKDPLQALEKLSSIYPNRSREDGEVSYAKTILSFDPLFTWTTTCNLEEPQRLNVLQKLFDLKIPLPGNTKEEQKITNKLLTLIFQSERGGELLNSLREKSYTLLDRSSSWEFFCTAHQKLVPQILEILCKLHVPLPEKQELLQKILQTLFSSDELLSSLQILEKNEYPLKTARHSVCTSYSYLLLECDPEMIWKLVLGKRDLKKLAPILQLIKMCVPLPSKPLSRKSIIKILFLDDLDMSKADATYITFSLQNLVEVIGRASYQDREGYQVFYRDELFGKHQEWVQDYVKSSRLSIELFNALVSMGAVRLEEIASYISVNFFH